MQSFSTIVMTDSAFINNDCSADGGALSIASGTLPSLLAFVPLSSTHPCLVPVMRSVGGLALERSVHWQPRSVGQQRRRYLVQLLGIDPR